MFASLALLYYLFSLSLYPLAVITARHWVLITSYIHSMLPRLAHVSQLSKMYHYVQFSKLHTSERCSSYAGSLRFLDLENASLERVGEVDSTNFFFFFHCMSIIHISRPSLTYVGVLSMGPRHLYTNLPFGLRNTSQAERVEAR